MMFGGLKKSASRLALVAAAGVLSTNAYAADLGGDCCADLEERVAELEATTARKGTRKTSLEIWGSVNKLILSWNDGANKNTFLGVDNTNYATRFGFRGNAKVSPGFSAGYSIMMDVFTGATTAGVRSDSMSRPLQNTALVGVGYENDHAIRVRDANVWLESSTLGRATLGRLSADGPAGTIDLAGIGFGAGSGSQSLIGRQFRFVNAAGTNTAGVAHGAAGANVTGSTIGNATDNAADYGNRVDGIKWSSPVLAGFTLYAGIGEAVQKDISIINDPTVTGTTKLGPYYHAALRYAGEFSGIRVAAAVGYEGSTSNAGNSAAATAINVDRPMGSNAGASLSLMHVATGLFAQGHYNLYKRGHDDQTSDTAKSWLVQAGVSKNWFGLGNTSLYGEYSKTTNGVNAFLYQNTASAFGGVATSLADADAVEKMWGLGVSQKVDAAALELYAGYRNHSLSSTSCSNIGGCKDIGLLYTGAKINF